MVRVKQEGNIWRVSEGWERLPATENTLTDHLLPTLNANVTTVVVESMLRGRETAQVVQAVCVESPRHWLVNTTNTLNADILISEPSNSSTPPSHESRQTPRAPRANVKDVFPELRGGYVFSPQHCFGLAIKCQVKSYSHKTNIQNNKLSSKSVETQNIFCLQKNPCSQNEENKSFGLTFKVNHWQKKNITINDSEWNRAAQNTDNWILCR